jgi:hypothetical protein
MFDWDNLCIWCALFSYLFRGSKSGAFFLGHPVFHINRQVILFLVLYLLVLLCRLLPNSSVYRFADSRWARFLPQIFMRSTKSRLLLMYCYQLLFLYFPNVFINNVLVGREILSFISTKHLSIRK